jgi:hypothetical protein
LPGIGNQNTQNTHYQNTGYPSGCFYTHINLSFKKIVRYLKN